MSPKKQQVTDRRTANVPINNDESIIKDIPSDRDSTVNFIRGYPTFKSMESRLMTLESLFEKPSLVYSESNLKTLELNFESRLAAIESKLDTLQINNTPPVVQVHSNTVINMPTEADINSRESGQSIDTLPNNMTASSNPRKTFPEIETTATYEDIELETLKALSKIQPWFFEFEEDEPSYTSYENLIVDRPLESEIFNSNDTMKDILLKLNKVKRYMEDVKLQPRDFGKHCYNFISDSSLPEFIKELNETAKKPNESKVKGMDLYYKFIIFVFRNMVVEDELIELKIEMDYLDIKVGNLLKDEMLNMLTLNANSPFKAIHLTEKLYLAWKFNSIDNVFLIDKYEKFSLNVWRHKINKYISPNLRVKKSIKDEPKSDPFAPGYTNRK